MNRQTHDRTRDHRGVDTTVSLVLSDPISGAPAGTNLTVFLRALTNQLIVFNHLEVALYDFGTGLEPVTDAAGDWLYGHYPNVVEAGMHLEVALYDFGSGLEPVTDTDGDWLYGNYIGV